MAAGKLTLDECFRVYPEGSEDVVELIKKRLADPADPGIAHKHHLLALGRNKSHKGLLRYWSKVLGREVEAADIPLVNVTPAEHFEIHLELAFCYYSLGSKGRFRAHGAAAGVLQQFADLDDEGTKLLREIQRETSQALARDPEWRAKQKTGAQANARDTEWCARKRAQVQAMAQTDEWQEKNRFAQAKSWAENPERREKHMAMMQTLWQDTEFRAKKRASTQVLWQDQEFRAKKLAQVQAMTQTDEWREKTTAVLQARWQDPGFREKQAAAVRAVTNTAEWRAKHKAAQQAQHPDVVVTFPDGREETFAGQSEAARALGCSIGSLGNWLSGKYPPSRKFKGLSFRYATPSEDPN